MEKLPHDYFSWIASFQKQRKTRRKKDRRDGKIRRRNKLLGDLNKKFKLLEIERGDTR
jgi:hypothetical protein